MLTWRSSLVSLLAQVKMARFRRIFRLDLLAVKQCLSQSTKRLGRTVEEVLVMSSRLSEYSLSGQLLPLFSPKG
jgi:hypothetical protein